MTDINTDPEPFWSAFADDFTERNRYVVGAADSDLIDARVAAFADLGEVIELACGDGRYSQLLAANAANVLATDFSTRMVARAAEILAPLTNVRVAHADAQSLAYPDASFDTVFAANLLHVLDAPEQVLAEGWRVLRLGGRLIALDLTMDGMTESNLQAMIERYLERYGRPPQRGRSLSLVDLRELCMAQAFSIEHAELLGNDCKAALVIGRKLGASGC